MTQPILTSPQELETWLDKLIAEQMDELQIPGVTFSVVQNGELFFAKGYGYADLANKIPVIAESTLFCVGGNTKLFTATAIMQLVEKGLLNLEDDVNNYLPNFQIENNYSQPLTIANLLTHTAGFDNSFIGMGALKASDIIPLGEHLAKKMPTLVRSPGEVIIGCNYSYGLLGYIIELIAGIPFSQYIEEKILQPLEMNHSSFELPPSLAANFALSYKYDAKQKTHKVLPFPYFQILPTASLNATATDMAQFAIAHLQNGRFKSQRILAETTAQKMQQQQFTNDPRLCGVGLGFWEFGHERHGQRKIGRIIGHSGGVVSGFRSHLWLLPSYNLGLFIANNGSGYISNFIIEQFCDRYFPVTENAISPQSSSENRPSLKRYEGNYRHIGYPRRSLAKVLILGRSPLHLKAEADGTLSVPETLKTSDPIYIKETEPLLLQLTKKNIRIVARESNSGKITHLLTDGSGVFKKLAWYETNVFHWILIIVFMVVFLSEATIGILAWTQFLGESKHQLAILLSEIICGLNLVFGLGMLLLKPLSKNNDQLQWIYGIPKIVTLLLCIPLVTSILAIGLTVYLISALINREFSLFEQIYYSLISLTTLSLIPFFNYWNLLGFRY